MAFWPKGSSVYTPMLNAARVHGRPIMVIAMIIAAIIQPAAIHRPPKINPQQVQKDGYGGYPRRDPHLIQRNHRIHPLTACQLRVVEGLTGFSSMSLPCFSTKVFALWANI